MGPYLVVSLGVGQLAVGFDDSLSSLRGLVVLDLYGQSGFVTYAPGLGALVQCVALSRGPPPTPFGSRSTLAVSGGMVCCMEGLSGRLFRSPVD